MIFCDKGEMLIFLLNGTLKFSFREEKEGPPDKKLKRTAHVVDQPEDPDKIVIDSVKDTTSWFEEVGE